MTDTRWDVRVADCLIAMSMLEANSIEACVTDPPYGLRFMGKAWDHGVPGVPYWRAVKRLLKPGAYLLAFGGTRTSHRLTCAIEDAGFRIDDSVGFAHTIARQVAELAATLDPVQLEAFAAILQHFAGDSSPLAWIYGSGFPKHKSKLKPSWEPIVMARKPAPRATLLNIDACRLHADDAPEGRTRHGGGAGVFSVERRGYDDGSTAGSGRGGPSLPSGRWPANVVLDEVSAGLLDQQSGDRAPGHFPNARGKGGLGCNGHGGQNALDEAFTESGGASRFYYVAKASRSEREAGLDGMQHGERYDVDPSRTSHRLQCFSKDARPGHATESKARNHHPTVKPVALMRWLVRLVTPPDGVVLDPFCGSGTTGAAAMLENRRFLGIDCSAEYADIARARLQEWESRFAPSLFDAIATGT